MAGTHRMRAAATLAALSLRASPDTSTMRLSRSSEQDGMESLFAGGGLHDRLVDVFGGVARPLVEQQQLGKGVVLQRQTFGPPAPDDAQQLGKQR